MKKRKKLILISIILAFFIFNYLMYRFYFFNSLHVLNEQKKSYSETKAKVDNIKQQQAKLEKLEIDNKELKRNAETLDVLAPKEIDTPQLAYDFYTSCLTYNVKGEELRFDLGDDENIEKKKNENKKEDVTFKKLTITLKISGKRNNLEEYLRNLNGITKRRLNIKSITLGESVENDSEKDSKEDSKDDLKKEKIDKVSYSNIKKNLSSKLKNGIIQSNSDAEVDEKIIDKKSTDEKIDNDKIKNDKKRDSTYKKKANIEELSAEIIFYQYIQGTGKDFDIEKNYDFYDKNIGFDSIADMFKKK